METSELTTLTFLKTIAGSTPPKRFKKSLTEGDV